MIERIAPRSLIVDGDARVSELGVPRGTNIFMLGVIFGMDPRIRDLISADELAASIASVVRKKPEENIAIFRAGMECGKASESR